MTIKELSMTKTRRANAIIKTIPYIAESKDSLNATLSFIQLQGYGWILEDGKHVSVSDFRDAHNIYMA